MKYETNKSFMFHASGFMKKAFTIVELIVVVGIIVLLTGTSIASYNNFTQNKELDTEAQKLKDVLNLAAKKAIAADTSNCLDADMNTKVIFYGLVSTDSISYSLIVNCNTSPLNITINRYPLPTGYKFSTTNAIKFYPLNKGSTSFQVRIANVNTNKNKCINVHITGLIEEPVSCI